MAIRLKTKPEIEKMRAAGRVVREVLDLCEELCKPGITTREIDDRAAALFESRGAKGLFKGYVVNPAVMPFPSNLCISINEVVVHGIADDRRIEDGDIVGIDCGVQLDGWCGDSATTILVGNVPPEVRKLCEVTRHCLRIATENIKPGRRWSQVARLMQNYAESHGYGVVRDFVGHGVGQTMHEDPKIPNYWDGDAKSQDVILRPGMTFAVEPMCNLGTKETRVLADGWTVVTADRKPSAHYEHTVAVTAEGCDVLTDGR